MKLPKLAAALARSRSASSQTISASLPPSSTELDAALLQMGAGACGNLTADRGGSGERNAPNARVLDKLLADRLDIGARAGHDVEHALGHACFGEYLGI
jgi:hypothetical protein